MLAWDSFLAELEKELGGSVVDEWLRSLRVLQFDAANLYLEAENNFQIHWFEEHVRPRLKTKLVNNNLRPISVHLRLRLAKPVSSSGSFMKPGYEIISDPLEADFTFEEFIPSGGNLMAHKLLEELSSGSLALGSFNPLLIYGPNGSGKTHLLTAAAHRLKKGKKVFFVKAETFTEHVVQAIRLGMMQTFRQIYRDIEVLIVDDIQVFAKKSATQEEFFHTFNALHTTGRQIILSSALPPNQLKEIEPRLISRFEWGLSTALELPDNQRQILEKKARLWNVSLAPEVFDLLLQEIASNPISALQALALRSGQTFIDGVQGKHLLKDFLFREKEKAQTPEQIIQKIAAHFGIKSEDILGKSQTREFALPRQISMFVCRKNLKMAYQAIGELFSRDHSTVMASVKQVQEGIEEKKQDLIDAIRSCSKESVRS